VMRFTYAGVFWEDRKPDAFLRALHNLLQEQPSLRGRIEAVFVGTFRNENRKLVVRLGLQNVVRILGYLPHIQCIRELLSSDVLWMTIGDDLGSPGKIYEYLGAHKPILACAPEGFLKAAVQDAGGVAVPPDDVAGIQKAIEMYFRQWEAGKLVGPSEEIVEKYNRVVLTRNLVRAFESLLEP
jgi:glycosyltransferase involved in cell wall biosynthesis